MKKVALGFISVVVWSVLLFPTLLLVSFLFDWLCTLPGIGKILSFLAYRIAVKGWVIPLLYVILALISSSIWTPLIHRIMHDCSERSVLVTKITGCVVFALLFTVLLIVGGDITLDSISYYVGFELGIIWGTMACEYNGPS